MRLEFSATLTLIFVLLAPSVTYAKTDVVIFVNGDRLTGEVKSLKRGKLRFKTVATDTISIEWDEVAFLTSNQNIQVETSDGVRYLGRLTTAATERNLVVEAASGPVDLETNQVVLMTPIEGTRRERLDGDITAGYNFAQASSVEQIQLGLDASYRTEIREFSLAIDTVMTDSQDNEPSRREALEIDSTRFWEDHWLSGVVIRLDRNDELGLDLRTSVGGGGGRILKQTNSQSLQLTGGLQVSRENVSGDESNEDTVEAFGALTWDWFRYDTPELDLSTNLQVIPNLSDTGRVRAEVDIKLKWEIVEDLFWQLSFYDSFDSDPVTEDAEKNDYGVNTSLGWEF